MAEPTPRFAALLFAALAVPCLADDLVTVRYVSAALLPSQSSEQTTLSISRRTSLPSVKETEVDRFFVGVRDALKEYAVGEHCGGLLIADGPFVEISVNLEGQAHKLTTSPPTLMSSLPDRGPGGRCERAARRILELATDQARLRLIRPGK